MQWDINLQLKYSSKVYIFCYVGHHHNMTFMWKIFPCMTNPFGIQLIVHQNWCTLMYINSFTQCFSAKAYFEIYQTYFGCCLAEASTESPMSITLIYMCLSNMDSYLCYTLMSTADGRVFTVYLPSLFRVIICDDVNGSYLATIKIKHVFAPS